MDLEELGYILYMESKDLESKDFNSLTDYEKINLNLNPYMESQTPTQSEEKLQSNKKS